jgi:hypothetical protein
VEPITRQLLIRRWHSLSESCHIRVDHDGHRAKFDSALSTEFRLVHHSLRTPLVYRPSPPHYCSNIQCHTHTNHTMDCRVTLARRVVRFIQKRTHTKPGTGSEAIGIAVDTTTLVLTVARDASRFVPLPLVQNVAGLALNIINIIQVR